MRGMLWLRFAVALLAGVALAMGSRAHTRPPSVGANYDRKTVILAVITVTLSLFTGILAINSFYGPTTSASSLSALFIVPTFHVAQAARGLQNSRVRSMALPVQCA